MNSIFTVIVTYNGLQWIEECLQSVVTDSTVIVVDNVSQDDTVNVVKANFPEVIVLEQQENLGFGKGNNVGISKALEMGASHVLLLNQDAKMKPSSLQKLVSFQKENATYGLLSPIHLDWSGDYLEGAFSRYTGYSNNKDFYSDFVLSKPIKEKYDIPFVAAACWVLSVEMLKTVGGFDPMFFYLGEDTNYCQRVHYHQFKIAVLPDCYVHHDTKDRPVKSAPRYSIDYFYKKDYEVKKKFGDVSLSNYESNFKAMQRKLTKEILFQTISGNFKMAKGARVELKKFIELKDTITRSRLTNVGKGAHYLNSSGN